MLEQYLREFGMAALTTILATFGGCWATGCATRVTSIGAVSEKPLFVLNVPGASLTVHSLEMTFERVEDETVE